MPRILSSPRGADPQSLLAKIVERLGRSTRVFFLVLVTLCLVEIAVDWNSTLYEINVLRDGLRRKAQSYADVLRKAAERALVSRDPEELRLLSAGLFDDEDTVFVRFVGTDEQVVYEELRPSYVPIFDARHERPFREHYAHVLSRDVHGMLTDPRGLQSRMQHSRHRDLIQSFTDGEDRLIAWLLRRKPVASESPPRALYQDRLADRSDRLDRDLTYALAVIVAPDGGQTTGVVLIAFRNDALNAAIRGKLLKGLAITVFFLLLILVQNVLGRRSKLRLLDLESVIATARVAIREALPTPPKTDHFALGLALRQAEQLGGTVYDLRVDERVELLVLSPRAHGVAIAFAALQLRDGYRRARAALPAGAPPGDLVRVLLAELDDASSIGPLAFVLVTLDRAGQVSGAVSDRRAPALLEGRSLVPITLHAAGAEDERLAGPLATFSAPLGQGWVALVEDGTTQASAQDAAIAQLADKLLRESPEAATDETVANLVRQGRARGVGDVLAFVARVIPT